MSTLSNWLSVNKNNDALNETFGRTSASWIRSFEKILNDINFSQIVQEFKNHISNENNPHLVTLTQIETSFLQTVWNYYLYYIAPYAEENERIMSFEEFEYIVQNNSIIWATICRDGVLNTLYQYQDMVGYRYTQPFYILNDTRPIQLPSALYSADPYFPDLTLEYFNTNTATFSSTPLNTLSAVISFVYEGNSTESWSITFNNTNTVPLFTLTYSPSDTSLSLTENSTLFTTPLTFPSLNLNPSGDEDVPLEYRAFIRLTPQSLSVMYSAGGVVTTQQIAFPTDVIISLESYTVSHPFWKGYGSGLFTRTIGLYATIVEDNVAEYILRKS